MKFLTLIILIALTVGCENRRTPSKYITPSGYSGVVLTIYGQSGYPTLPRVDGYIVHSYPEDGILITSDSMQYGWAPDLTEEILEDGSTRQLSESESGERNVLSKQSGSQSGPNTFDLVYSGRIIGDSKSITNLGPSVYEAKISEAVQKLESAKGEQSAGENASRLTP
jgi:hypothetical protein